MKLDMVFFSPLVESVSILAFASPHSLLVPLYFFVAVATYFVNVETRTGAFAASSNMWLVTCGHVTEENACV